MTRRMMQGDPLYILFDEQGESVFDSQNRPRMYKSVEAFQRAFPRGIDGVHLKKYIPSQTWFSVKDEPPKHTFLLVWCEVAKCVEMAKYNGCYWVTEEKRRALNADWITHWMHLPEEPKEE